MEREEFYEKYMSKRMDKYKKLEYSMQWINAFAEIEELEEKAWRKYSKI